MSDYDHKAALHYYLRRERDAMIGKLNGLSEYDRRRPMTATGTNLLGLVKHLTCVTADYFGPVFDRPFADPPPWFDPETEPGADMWATPDQTSEDLIALYHRAWAHADATIDALDLHAPGHVPWWRRDSADVTLGRIMVHMNTELARHTGHADIIREHLDGTTGLRRPGDIAPSNDAQWWVEHHARLEAAARAA